MFINFPFGEKGLFSGANELLVLGRASFFFPHGFFVMSSAGWWMNSQEVPGKPISPQQFHQFFLMFCREIILKISFIEVHELQNLMVDFVQGHVWHIHTHNWANDNIKNHFSHRRDGKLIKIHATVLYTVLPWISVFGLVLFGVQRWE